MKPSTNKDYYAILGVEKDATQEDIKKAFRTLAIKYHPDKNAGDKAAEERFKDISEAYDTLCDSDKRRRYDMFGNEGPPNPFAQTGMGGWGNPFEGFDFFNMNYGGMGGMRARQSRSQDVNVRASLSFEEAILGKKVEFSYSRTEKSTGEGGFQACPMCGGNGKVTIGQGMFLLNQVCPECGGSKKVPLPVTVSTKMTINVRPGVGDGQKIVVQGEGNRNRKNPGDLVIHVSVQPHKFFHRVGDNVRLEIPITVAQAILGAEVVVPSVDGKKMRLSVPAGTASGSVFSMKGLGVPGKGDMHVRVVVGTPRITDEEMRLLVVKLQAKLPANGEPTPISIE